MRTWRWNGSGVRNTAALVCLAFLMPALIPVSAAAANTEQIAQRIAESLIALPGKGTRYKTIAFSHIRTISPADLDLDELIDYATTKILQTVLELDVINRAQLKRILKEQKFQLSDIVSADEYKELGQLAGIDLFIYGNLYTNALILKAIDVQNSTIAWAEFIPLEGAPEQWVSSIRRLGTGIVQSMKTDRRLKRANIKTVSFWDFKSTTGITEEEVVDILTVYLTKDGSFKVVDRNNLKLILGEQALNQAVFFDEQSAAELGGLFGVQAFINGNLKQDGRQIVADFKMTDIYTGKFVWAAIIKIDEDTVDGDAKEERGQAGRQPKAARGMALVSAGVFVQGTNGTPVDARPAHQVKLPAFHIDIAEVSNRDYNRFVEKRNHRTPVGWIGRRYPAGSADLPVTGVSWDDARDYCRFLGKRLPSESEWEKAARGTGGQIYPWEGINFVPGYTVTRESGRKGPAQVHAAGKDISPYGIKHMAGNVREWVNDVLKPYAGGISTNPKFHKERVLRGSSWAQNARAAATFFRGSSERNLAWPDVSFRCAKSASIPVPQR